MKTVRFITVMVLLSLLVLPVFANGQTEKTEAKVEEKVMTHDELVEAAKAEGTLTVYTYSSRTTKIGDAFTALYGIPVEVTQLKDTEMIEKVSKEAAANLDAADVVFCQDGSRVIPELVYTGYVTRYVPENVEGHIVDAEFEDPLVFEAMPKVFIYNNEDGGGAIYVLQPNYTSRALVVDCLFTNNYVHGQNSMRGGAIYSARGVEIRRCRFVDNWSQSVKSNPRGGTVSAGSSSWLIDSSFSVRNTADRVTKGLWGRLVELTGGAMEGGTCPQTIDGCTFGPVENDGAGVSSVIYIEGSFDGEFIANSTFQDLAVAGTQILDLPGTVTGRMRN